MGANSILSMHLMVQAVVSEVTEQVANVFLGQKLNKTHNNNILLILVHCIYYRLCAITINCEILSA